MPMLTEVAVGQTLPSRARLATNVSLFAYNAVLWNAHRIHYDEHYAVNVEHHPGIVIDGPLQGDWLTQEILEWLGEDGTLVEFEYSNRSASYLGQTLAAGGQITAIYPSTRLVTLELAITGQAGQVTTPGQAVVKLHGLRGHEYPFLSGS